MILALAYCRFRAIPIRKIFDFAAPIGVLAIAVQRGLGCFMAGCCYGHPTDLPMGIRFTTISRAGLAFPDTPLHPTQLYYSLASLVLFFCLLRLKKKGHPPGALILLGLGFLTWGYALITFIRGDTHPELFYNTQSLSQFISFVIAFTCFVYYLILRRHPRVDDIPNRFRMKCSLPRSRDPQCEGEVS